MQITSQPYHFIDANVIMYTVGGPHPLRDPCKHILEEIKTGKLTAVTNTEVLQEILHRFYSIEQFSFGEIAYQSMVQICVHIFPVTLKETNMALELLKAYKNITSRDAVHAATMLNNRIAELISTDSHFDLITGIKRISPADFNPDQSIIE